MKIPTANQRETLEALRDLIADELEHGAACRECGGGLASPTAPLAKQLRDTLDAIRALPAVKGSVTDELKQQRARRHATVAKRAAEGTVKRRAGGQARS